MIAELKNCTVCGSRLNGSVAGLGSVCPSCIVRAVRTPCASHANTVSEDVDATTWADIFPQFEIERSLRKSDETPVYLARVEDEEPRKRVVIQIVTGKALEKAGGAPALTVRARKLAACQFDGLLPVLDFGDLSDAFFLVTEAHDGPLLTDTLAGADSDLSADLLVSLDSCRQRLASETSQAGVELYPDPTLAFGGMNSGTGAIHFTPSVLPAGSSAAEQTPPSPAAFRPEPDARLGPFVFEEKLGEGGFGEVWRARQQQPAERQVALKILKQGLHSSRARARFDLEQSALARLAHPHIARLYEAGTTLDGRPFFAMEWVDGTTLNRFWKDEKPPLDRSLELFAQVCRAVEHAHLKGILHRDLKPSNVMVATEGESASAKVIDFGIARALEDPSADQTLLTRPFDLMGTPVYMSPEQIAASSDADARSDVYSLGVVLYEALCAQLPFDPKLPLPKLQRAILDDEPLRPSQRLADQAQARKVRGDLDWVTLKCLEKDPERRYQSVAALLLDIERYAKNEPVEAGPPEWSYRIRKFVRRNRVAVAAATAVTLALVVGLILATVGFSRALHEAVKAREAEKETETALLTTDRALTDSRVSTAFLNSDLGQDSEAALWLAYAAKHAKDPERAVENKRRFIEWTRGLAMPIAATKLESPFSWDLKFAPGSELLRIITFHGTLEDPERRVQLLPVFESEPFVSLAKQVFRAADFHPRKNQIALVDADGLLSIYDWDTKQVVASVALLEASLADVAFSKDGSRLAIGGIPRDGDGDGDGEFAVAVLRADQLEATPNWVPLSAYPLYLEWNLDDRYLVVGEGANEARIFRVGGPPVELGATHDDPIKVYSLFPGTFSHMMRPMFTRDGQSVILADYEARRYGLAFGEVNREYERVYGNPFRGLALAPDLRKYWAGEELYATHGSNVLPISRPDQDRSSELRADNFIMDLANAPDGASLVTGGTDRKVLIWNLQESREAPPEEIGIHSRSADVVSFSKTGLLLATVQFDGLVRVWRHRYRGTIPDFYFPIAWATDTAGAGESFTRGWNYRWEGSGRGRRSTAWPSVNILVNCDSTIFVPIAHNRGGNRMFSTATWSLADESLLAQGFFTGGLIVAGVFSPVDPKHLVTAHLTGSVGELAFWDATNADEVGVRIPILAAPRKWHLHPEGGGSQWSVPAVKFSS